MTQDVNVETLIRENHKGSLTPDRITIEGYNRMRLRGNDLELSVFVNRWLQQKKLSVCLSLPLYLSVQLMSHTLSSFLTQNIVALVKFI